MDQPCAHDTGVTRRKLVKGGLAVAGTWTLIGVVTPTSAEAAETPPGFPTDIALHRNVFQNWDGTIVTDELWTCEITTPEQAETIVNWAAGADYRVRPRGFGHTWSPLVVESGTCADAAVVVVDTTGMAAMSMVDGERVRLQAGADMTQVLSFLSTHGRSLIGAPAPGDVTVAGVLAVNGHGTNVAASGEGLAAGGTYGTLSNAVVELTAVVWDESAGKYTLRTFQRNQPEIAPLLAHVGRAFVTEVVLQTVANYNLRCRNTTLIPASELFAAPESAGPRSLSALLDRRGRVGIIWYAMTQYPWVQTWQVTPTEPLLSSARYAPFNYPFADRLSDEVASLITQVTQGAHSLTPKATAAMMYATRAGLVANGALDMWGEAKNFIHFVRPTTLLVSAGSHVVITRRDQVQRVVADFTTHYQELISTYRSRGQYPANNVCEIRLTGVDRSEDVTVDGAVVPSLSSVTPVPGRPELDTAVWLDVLSLPGTPGTGEFYAEIDAWFRNLSFELGVARPEWSKRFAHTAAGPWTDDRELKDWIPGQFPAWQEALTGLDALDPQGIFRTPLHDRLMPRSEG